MSFMDFLASTRVEILILHWLYKLFWTWETIEESRNIRSLYMQKFICKFYVICRLKVDLKFRLVLYLLMTR